jgi:lysophospholipase L1-like esterase
VAINTAVGASGFELTTGAIGLAARRSNANNTQFLLLVAPSNLQVYAADLPSDVLRAEMAAENFATDQLITFAHERGIEFLDLRPAFIAAAARGEELYPSYDVHWTAAGNQLAANAVADWLEAKESQKKINRPGDRTVDRQP